MGIKVKRTQRILEMVERYFERDSNYIGAQIEGIVDEQEPSGFREIVMLYIEDINNEEYHQTLIPFLRKATNDDTVGFFYGFGHTLWIL